ncbi:MAG TPA: hypothetical protein VJZ72_09790 [Candidatus Limnocylindrales bacterium]|nr:hypothetical protein [Candidatus Limnocylindrales bacterium]
MCCLFTALLFLGPRAAVLVWALIEPVRWSAAFDSFVWPLLGLVFVPWTTLAYVIVAPGGVEEFDWVFIIVGLVADVAEWGGGGYGNRQRLTSYYGYEE